MLTRLPSVSFNQAIFSPAAEVAIPSTVRNTSPKSLGLDHSPSGLELRDAGLDIIDPDVDRGRLVVPANWDG